MYYGMRSRSILAAVLASVALYAVLVAHTYNTSYIDCSDEGWCRLVDDLDVWDNASETEHDYTHSDTRFEGWSVLVERGSGWLIDHGRDIFEGESFKVETVPGQDLLIKRRYHTWYSGSGTSVKVDGTYVGDCEEEPEGERENNKFAYNLCLIEGRHIKSGRPTVHIGTRDGGTYTAYTYWFFTVDESPIWLLRQSGGLWCLYMLLAAAIIIPWTAALARWGREAAMGVGLFAYPSMALLYFAGWQYAVAYAGIYLVWDRTDKLRSSAWTALSNKRRFLPGLLGVFLIASYAASIFIIQGIPVSNDGPSYVIQAKLFASGMMSAPGIEDDGFVYRAMMMNGERVYSKYAPGHALMLAIGVLTGSAWNITPLLGALALFFAFNAADAAYGRRVAIVSSLFMLSAPVFILTSATEISEVSDLFFLSGFTWCFIRGLNGRKPRWAMAAGMFLGLAFVTRTLTAMMYSGPFIAFGAASLVVQWRRGKTDASRAVGAFATGFMLLALIYPAFNAAQTGDPFQAPYLLYQTDDSPLLTLSDACDGFWGPTCIASTLWERIDYSKLNLMLLFEAFKWRVVSPAIFLAIPFIMRRWNGWDICLASSMGAVIMAYSFYWFMGEIAYGPVYYYELILPLSLLIGRGACMAFDALSARMAMRKAFVILTIVLALSGVTSGLLGGHPLWSIGIWTLEQQRAEFGRADMPRQLADEMGLKDAVVFVNRDVPLSFRFIGLTSPAYDEDVLYFFNNGDRKNTRFMENFPGRSCHVYDGVAMRSCALQAGGR